MLTAERLQQAIENNEIIMFDRLLSEDGTAKDLVSHNEQHTALNEALFQGFAQGLMNRKCKNDTPYFLITDESTVVNWDLMNQLLERKSEYNLNFFAIKNGTRMHNKSSRIDDIFDCSSEFKCDYACDECNNK